MAYKIPFPITFNPHKHHLGFLLQKLKTWQNKEWPEVTDELKVIGNNLVDLYYGSHSVSEICNECLRYFKTRKINSHEKFLEWLSPNEYQKIELSDESIWIIKKGTNIQRYIHIHPAKNSPLTIRVRATTLKTAIALKIQEKKLPKNPVLHLQNVNQIRTEILGFSPVKNLTRGKGISKIFALFNSS
jgi:hypothetical protein